MPCSSTVYSPRRNNDNGGLCCSRATRSCLRFHHRGLFQQHHSTVTDHVHTRVHSIPATMLAGNSRVTMSHHTISWSTSTVSCVPRPYSRLRSQHSTVAAAEPTVTLKFVTLEAPSEPLVVECPSGEQLRACMLENKVDLYTTWGKIWSCGGAGQCGTCIVQVTEGADLLSERTATEDKKLNKKPEDWRLACQTIVGDGTNSGTVVIRTKPQGK